MGFWDESVGFPHEFRGPDRDATLAPNSQVADLKRLPILPPNPHAVCNIRYGLYAGGPELTESLIVVANLALLALVAVPAIAVLLSGVRSILTRRRRRVDWVHISWVGEIPVLRE